jgi:hypothetical protein
LKPFLGTNLRVVQQAVWWSTANPVDSSLVVRSKGSASLLQSGGHEREVFDAGRVNRLYQTDLMRKEFPAQSKLHDMITAAGIQASHIPYGFFLPLVMAWCQLPEPFDLTQSATGSLLDEFAKAIIDGRSVSRYRDTIVGLGLGKTPVELEKGVAIRTIEEDELWDLTSGSISSTPFFPPIISER